MQIQIAYFAQLRELRGESAETCTTSVTTAAALYDELNHKHSFGLDREHLRVAVNDEFVDWNMTLKENDRVVFIPPVAGG